jgi:hypothetical protein
LGYHDPVRFRHRDFHRHLVSRCLGRERRRKRRTEKSMVDFQKHQEGQMKDTTYIIKASMPVKFEAQNDVELQTILKSLIRQNYKDISVEKGEESA